jgi:hypothetical protein
MPKCIHCKSDRIISISGKTSDCFSATYKDINYDGYVPATIGLGEGGDYIEFSYCADCGKIQQHFPIQEAIIQNEMKGE